ncbi:MAG: Ldh family oxidoreductase, partial [Acidimicrobiaceae bacterium]|nr:Ldh family oxidoreductase [Acidimicrobiaceae bacterium]
MNEPDPARGGAMRREDPDFLEHCYRRVLGGLGFSGEHAEVLARCVSDGDRNGKLTQGMGVFEIPVLLARTGTMDVTAVPEVVDEGPAWLVIDARR